MNIFEKATRNKLRISTEIGMLSVEQLWDLPLKHATKTNLDDIAKRLARLLKETQQPSFVDNKTEADSEIRLQMALVLHVIGVKVTERDAAIQAKERASKRDQILSLIAQKENEQLAGSSLEDLRKLAAELS